MRAEVGKIKENIEIITNSARHGLLGQKKEQKKESAGGWWVDRKKEENRRQSQENEGGVSVRDRSVLDNSSDGLSETTRTEQVIAGRRPD